MSLAVKNVDYLHASCLWVFDRIYISANGVFQQDYDDDGEFAAGGRLLHLLQVRRSYGICINIYFLYFCI